MEPNKNYICKKGQFHNCRFCGRAIRKNTPKGLQPLANFAMATIKTKEGPQFRFNGCVRCLKKLDFQDVEILTKICDNDDTGQAYTPAPGLLKLETIKDLVDGR